MAEGTWDPSVPIWEQIKTDPGQSMAYLSDINATVVPGEVRMEVEQFIPQLAEPGVEGQQLPFAGPVADNTGNERLAAGARFSDDDLLRMCWCVDGVVDPGEDGRDVPAVVAAGCQGDR